MRWPRGGVSNASRAVAPVAGNVHFALKANSALGVIALLARHGAGADIVSGGELDRALAAGIAPPAIVISGVGKSRTEIAQALTAGIGQINAESPAELDSISSIANELGVIAPVALRVNVNVEPDTHAKPLESRKGLPIPIHSIPSIIHIQWAFGLRHRGAALLINENPRNPEILDFAILLHL